MGISKEPPQAFQILTFWRIKNDPFPYMEKHLMGAV